MYVKKGEKVVVMVMVVVVNSMSRNGFGLGCWMLRVLKITVFLFWRGGGVMHDGSYVDDGNVREVEKMDGRTDDDVFNLVTLMVCGLEYPPKDEVWKGCTRGLKIRETWQLLVSE